MPSSAGGTPVRTACAIVVAAFAFSCAWFTGFFPPFASPNELSRFQTTVAFVETGSFAIESQLAALGDHEDKASAGGRFYSNKAPGLALAAIPVYRVLRLVLPAPDSPSAPVFFLLRLFTVSLLCVFALLRFSRRLLRHRDGDTAAALVTFAVAFGTPFLFYSRSFFAHAWTASLLFLAWDLLRDAPSAPSPARRGLRVAVAGFVAAWALISEYTVAPAVAILAVRAAFPAPGRRSGADMLAFVAGMALPVGILLAYQAVCFGSPFALSYAHEAYPAYAKLSARRFLGFGFPSVGVALAYLFHPARGILLFSPFFLWAGVGAARWCHDRRVRADGLFAVAATLATYLFLSGYPNWHGGWALGSRYLLPLLFLPAAALPYALSTSLSRGFFAAAAVISAGVHVLETLSWPFFPIDFRFPVASASVWFLRRGWIAPNLATSIGLPAAVAVGVPVVVALLALAAALAAARPMTPRAPVAAIAGAAVLVLALMRPPALAYPARLLRAAIYGDYSGRDAARRELKAVVDEASTPLEKRQAAMAWSTSGSR
jgi:hypothetical protein